MSQGGSQINSRRKRFEEKEKARHQSEMYMDIEKQLQGFMIIQILIALPVSYSHCFPCVMVSDFSCLLLLQMNRMIWLAAAMA
jgi:hypothetical protein